ncbi:MAG: ActS/PrrB/RegB family redox-sensitive histidine kinase, partial [Pseudomonadota bacterium]
LITLISNFHLPLKTGDGTVLQLPHIFAFGFWVSILIAIAFISIYTRRVTQELSAMAEALLATQMALAREQKLTDLGGVVAATAHELGTPLATIKLVSTELLEDLTDNDDLRDDALLIKEQADRCRDILQSMGRAGKDDTHLRYAPFSAVVEEAAEPHQDRGKSVVMDITGDAGPYPIIQRQPEIIHGLRNIIQNAVDFSSSGVVIDVRWTAKDITVTVTDDGRGFSPYVINRLGDPFLHRRSTSPDRPEYEGMGLGLFIAKTLLGRSGATVQFRNKHDAMTPFPPGTGRGAQVVIMWPRHKIEHKDKNTPTDNPMNA